MARASAFPVFLSIVVVVVVILGAGLNFRPSDTNDSTIQEDNVPSVIDHEADNGTPTSNDGPPSGSSSPSLGPPTDQPPSDPEPEPEPAPELTVQYKKAWTTLFYVAYDNSIGPMDVWEDDLWALETIGSTVDMNLLAFVDQEMVGDCHVLVINEGGSYQYSPSIIDPAWGDEMDTADHMVLQSFLEWGVEYFPAEYYDFHIMDHGGAWMGACTDDNGNASIITAAQYAGVFAHMSEVLGRRIDIVSFDMCFMSNFEFVWETSDSVHYHIGLMTYAVGDYDEDGRILGNWNMAKIWGGLKDNPHWTPDRFSLHHVENMQVNGPYFVPQLLQTKLQTSDTMSATDMTLLEPMKEAFSMLSKELYSSVTGPNEIQAERQLINEVLGSSSMPPEYYTEVFSGQSEWAGIGQWYLFDLGDFTNMLAEHGDLLCNRETALNVSKLVDEVVIACTHGNDSRMGEHPDAHGLHVYIPFRSGKYNEDYSDVLLAQETMWDEFLKEVPWGQ